MTGAPYTNPSQPPPVTGRSFRRIGLTLLCVLGVVGGMLLLLLTRQGKSVAQSVGEPAVTPWKSPRVYGPVDEKPATVSQPAPRDETADNRLAALERQQGAILAALDAMDKRRTTTATPPRPHPPVEPKKYGPPLYIANKLEASATPPASATPTYTLAPGATKLPCVIETAINSDVPGWFTAKVTTNVYDTATGRHLLVPQGSTILGKDQAESLIYGNERLPTISLTLTLPSGRSVELGNAPMTDQAGRTGLPGEVDTHFWRLVGAVFVGGALRGGTQAIQTTVASAGPAGSVAAGIGQQASQVGQTVNSRAMDTRPTITVEAGQLCQVLLTRELTLPALWQ